MPQVIISILFDLISSKNDFEDFEDFEDLTTGVVNLDQDNTSIDKTWMEYEESMKPIFLIKF